MCISDCDLQIYDLFLWIALVPQDSAIYLIGTWEGLIHKCSVSNNQYFLQTYQKHFVSFFWLSKVDHWVIVPSTFGTLSRVLFIELFLPVLWMMLQCQTELWTKQARVVHSFTTPHQTVCVEKCGHSFHVLLQK